MPEPQLPLQPAAAETQRVKIIGNIYIKDNIV